MRLLFTLAIGLAAASGSAAAQTPSPRTLPLVSVDAAVGYSGIPARAGAIFYRETMITAGRVGAAVRLGARGAIRPVLVLDYSGELINSGVDAVCIYAPNGTCKDSFPSFSGFGIGLGGRALLGNRVVVGASGGVGRYGQYNLADPQGGTDSLFGGRRTSYFVDAEVSARFSRRLGVVLNVRHVELPNAAGSRLWYRPITFGLRIQ